MTNEELQAKYEELQGRLDRELKREIPWFKARFNAISADPMTAAFCVAVTVILYRFAVPAVKWFLT